MNVFNLVIVNLALDFEPIQGKQKILVRSSVALRVYIIQKRSKAVPRNLLDVSFLTQ